MSNRSRKPIDLIPQESSLPTAAGISIDRMPTYRLSLADRVGLVLRRRRNRRYLASTVEIELESLLELHLSGQGLDRGPLLAGLAAGFSTIEMQRRIVNAESHLARRVDQVAKNGAANVRQRIDLQTDRIEHISGHLHDLRGAIDPFDWPDLEIPPPPETIEEDFVAKERARHGLVQERRHLVDVALGCALATAAVGIEFEVLLLTIDGIWGGTSPSSDSLVFTMTVGLTSLMLWLASLARAGSGWFSRATAAITLVVLAGCLALFRSGLLTPTGSVAEGVLGLELIAINVLVFVSSLGMSFLGEFAIDRARKAVTAYREFQDTNAEGLAKARARLRTLVAHDWFRRAKRELAQKVRVAFERGVPDAVNRTEGQLLREHAETRRILRDELRQARRKLDGEIETIADQLARWWYEERAQ